MRCSPFLIHLGRKEISVLILIHVPIPLPRGGALPGVCLVIPTDAAVTPAVTTAVPAGTRHRRNGVGYVSGGAPLALGLLGKAFLGGFFAAVAAGSSSPT